jgi:hypothetical protein
MALQLRPNSGFWKHAYLGKPLNTVQRASEGADWRSRFDVSDLLCTDLQYIPAKVPALPAHTLLPVSGKVLLIEP